MIAILRRTALPLALVLAAAPALADGMRVEDAYVRVSGPAAQSGAIFLQVLNETGADDRLIGAETQAAARAELHTHQENAQGVMRMVHVEDGFPVAAGETLSLERGGRHVMLMGLTAPLAEGDTVPLTLHFEGAGTVDLSVPVDNTRTPMGHGG